MSSFLSGIVTRISASTKSIKGIIFDKIIAEVDIKTVAGNGFLFCQLREDSKGKRYIVLKTKGGDATVFVNLEEDSVRSLVDFIKSRYLDP